MPSLAQVITNAISFTNTARFSIFRWAVQKWSVFIAIFIAWRQHWKEKKCENRNAVWTIYN